jgi:hypothetical protein
LSFPTSGSAFGIAVSSFQKAPDMQPSRTRRAQCACSRTPAFLSIEQHGFFHSTCSRLLLVRRFP